MNFSRHLAFYSVAVYHSRLKQVPGSAACCIRKDRRRILSKVKANLQFPLQQTFSYWKQMYSFYNSFWLCVFACVVQGNSKPVYVERLTHFSQDPYQREYVVYAALNS